MDSCASCFCPPCFLTASLLCCVRKSCSHSSFILICSRGYTETFFFQSSGRIAFMNCVIFHVTCLIDGDTDDTYICRLQIACHTFSQLRISAVVVISFCSTLQCFAKHLNECSIHAAQAFPAPCLFVKNATCINHKTQTFAKQ